MASSESEKVTREERIKRALSSACWDPIVRYSSANRYLEGAVEEHPTASGPADYVLFSEGAPIAAVEAKRVGIGPQSVLSQAERYSRGFQGGPFSFGEYHIPFVYSTNGEVIWFRDLRRPDSRSREVARFHTPAALREMLDRDARKSEKWLRENAVNYPGLRPYQIDAIRSIENGLLAGKRKMLVAMATGTGKTRNTIALLHRLLHSGTVRRVLFLVDRRALAAQAAGEMAAFEAEPALKFDRIYEVYTQKFRREDVEGLDFDPKILPTRYLKDPQPGMAFVYVCTIQRMRINLFGRPTEQGEVTGDVDEETDAERMEIPMHAFDCIIADECHRGYTSQEESKWREVLDYFDAIKIGLTATPAAHTTAYFGEVVYRYDFDRAVREGYLVDYDHVTIDSGVRMKGVFLSEGEEVEYVDTTTGRGYFDTLEDEREFDPTEVERKVTAPDSNKKIVREYLKHAFEHEKKHGQFPKTIVFAVNDLQHTSHADQLVSILRDECGRGDDFVQKITGNPNVDRPLQRIRQFRNRNEPAIVVTVDMLTTGVDIPKCEALLFLRPVKSRILFEQMMGRGTRKCDDIHKSHFLVFDSVGLLDYFKKATDFTADAPVKPSRSIRDVIGAIANNQEREYNTRVLVRRMQRVHKTISSDGREVLSKWIPYGDVGGFAKQLPDLLRDDWTNTMTVLRDAGFQNALDDYPRVPRSFVIAHGVEDTVVSTYHFRTADGREMKPEDYIMAFERFVRENPEHIEALNLLLRRPRSFNTNVLSQLRKKLAERPEKYTEENLRRAYQKELADIISIIKHAVTGEPLITAQERVDRAMSDVMEGKTFTLEQEKWLQLIRDHLARNLLVEKDHFSTIPFSRYGGWKRADSDFEGKLEELILNINEAVLA